MPMPDKKTDDVEKSLVQYAKAWGESPISSLTLATLITAQHGRPFSALPMLFPPVLLLSSYMNVSGYKIDSAGVTGAWSALYLILALRRRQAFMNKWGTRGLIRGGTLGLCVANVVGGGLAYGFGRRTKEERRAKGM